jgi:cell division protein FtsB
VGGVFAKTFTSGVHPVEIVAALKKDIDAQTYELQKLREENLRNTVQISTLQDKLNR